MGISWKDTRGACFFNILHVAIDIYENMFVVPAFNYDTSANLPFLTNFHYYDLNNRILQNITSITPNVISTKLFKLLKH